jgi:hypothetical protein
MKISGPAALTFRRAVAVIVVLIISAGAAYDLRRTPELDSDGATIIFFVLHQPVQSAQQMNNLDQSLIATEVMFAQTTVKYVSTVAGKVQILASPCNGFNLEHPDYEEQCATITATAPNAGAVKRAFWQAYRGLSSRLKGMQIRSGVPSRHRIRTYLVGASGPVSLPGSRVRVLAGLSMLTLIGVLTVWRFFTLRRNRTPTPRRRFFALHGNQTPVYRSLPVSRRHSRRTGLAPMDDMRA